MRQGRRVGGAALVAALAGLCALAGCSSSPNADSLGHSTTTSASSSTTTSTVPASTSSTSPRTAVLAAYRAGWAAFEHALADANPDDPELVTTMVDPELQQVKANMLADQQHGMVGRGTFALHPKITNLSATSATVVDCAYSTAELVYQATGKPVPPVTPPENDGVTSTLVLSGGTWKVSKQIVTDGKCAPGA
jgi:endonuclease/exonuclease/phosphatase (EEP) superfamily protein YafD